MKLMAWSFMLFVSAFLLGEAYAGPLGGAVGSVGNAVGGAVQGVGNAVGKAVGNGKSKDTVAAATPKGVATNQVSRTSSSVSTIRSNKLWNRKKSAYKKRQPYRGQAAIISMIQSMAPKYGVPAAFAIKIAKAESGFNPTIRGRHGEYGIFQMKCQTARGLGMTGNCSQLANAQTNIKWGLMHLKQALRESRGNLRMAASKHNCGLACNKMQYGYLRKLGM